MTAETILTPELVDSLLDGVLKASGSRLGNYTLQKTLDDLRSAMRAIEQAILQSPEIQALKRDKERLDWLAYVDNRIGNVQLPKACVERNPHSLRDAIDDAMEQQE